MPDFDVIVLGTGAAGLTAAIAAHDGGARVGVFEKANTVGGTSAWSGGQIWIPNNPHQRALGKPDSRADALTYLMSLSHGMIDREMAEAYVDSGSEMIEFLEANTPVRFVSVPDFPDYHPEFPGGKPEGGRTLECALYPYGELGDWSDRVGTSPYYPDFTITIGETTLGQPVPQEVSQEEKARRRANDERGMGLALPVKEICLDFAGASPTMSFTGAIDDDALHPFAAGAGGRDCTPKRGVPFPLAVNHQHGALGAFRQALADHENVGGVNAQRECRTGHAPVG